jgi:hypothetical protein
MWDLTIKAHHNAYLNTSPNKFSSDKLDLNSLESDSDSSSKLAHKNSSPKKQAQSSSIQQPALSSSHSFYHSNEPTDLFKDSFHKSSSSSSLSSASSSSTASSIVYNAMRNNSQPVNNVITTMTTLNMAPTAIGNSYVPTPTISSNHNAIGSRNSKNLSETKEADGNSASKADASGSVNAGHLSSMLLFPALNEVCDVNHSTPSKTGATNLDFQMFIFTGIQTIQDE